MTLTRRDFLTSALAGSVALGSAERVLASQQPSDSRKEESKRAAKLPVIVCSEYS